MTEITLGEQDILCHTRAEVGEGPQWDGRINRFYWIDITQGRLLWLQHNSQEATVHEFGRMIGTIVLTVDPPVVLVALEDGLFYFHTSTRETTFFSHPAKAELGNRYNDGKLDRQGRLWVASMHPNGREGRGSLYCCGPDGSSRRELKDLAIPNGLDWSHDDRTFYFVDSPEKRIRVYEFDNASGRLGKMQTVLDLGNESGIPDGFTIDRQERLWIAFWGGYCVKCYDSKTSECLYGITTPAAQTASCIFGGPKGDRLYITTANYLQEAHQPMAGLTYRIDGLSQGISANRMTTIQAPRDRAYQ